MAFSRSHICQCLSRISTLRRDSPITISGIRRINGEDFAAGVAALARGLSEELGVREGDVVAIAALNSDWYLELLLAIAYVGGIAAPLNYRWSFEEARYAMELVGPTVLVVDESCYVWSLELQNYKNTKLHSLRSHVLLGYPSSSLSNTLNMATTNTIKRPSNEPQTYDYRWSPKGIALICFTSGTTGRPKGVAICHTSLIVQSLAKIATVGYGEDDVYLHTAPLCHIGGISSCMAMLMVGACHVFIPKFEARSAVQAIERHHVTSLITVPAMVADLVSTLREERRWTGGESVKKILNGGGGLSNELLRGASHVFPNAKILSAYGMTEACSSLTFMTLHDPTVQNPPKSLGTIPTIDLHAARGPKGTLVGKSAPHVELRISVNDHGDYDVSVGRILTRGPHVMTGYWGHIPAEGSDSDEGGWLDTGDIGWMDGCGDLWLVGRTKDRIKSGGENVYPEEVKISMVEGKMGDDKAHVTAWWSDLDRPPAGTKQGWTSLQKNTSIRPLIFLLQAISLAVTNWAAMIV